MRRATEPLQLGFGLGIRVVCAGQGLRISRGLGAWLKLKSPIRSPRMAAFSRTSVLGLLRHLAAAGLLALGDKGGKYCGRDSGPDGLTSQTHISIAVELQPVTQDASPAMTIWSEVHANF